MRSSQNVFTLITSSITHNIASISAHSQGENDTSHTVSTGNNKPVHETYLQVQLGKMDHDKHVIFLIWSHSPTTTAVSNPPTTRRTLAKEYPFQSKLRLEVSGKRGIFWENYSQHLYSTNRVCWVFIKLLNFTYCWISNCVAVIVNILLKLFFSIIQCQNRFNILAEIQYHDILRFLYKK